MLIFTLSSACFEPEGSSSGRRMYVQVRYSLFSCKCLSSLVGGGCVCVCLCVRARAPPTRMLIPLHINKLYQTCTYIRLPEDEPSGSKHVEDNVQIKILS
jgi:hypothetical protein